MPFSSAQSVQTIGAGAGLGVGTGVGAGAGVEATPAYEQDLTTPGEGSPKTALLQAIVEVAVL